MNQSLDGAVKTRVYNQIGEICFSHPAHNSMPGSLLAQLVKGIEEMDLTPEVKIIFLKSGGNRTFCAGASFEELVSISTVEEGKRFFSGFASVINACRLASKLIIGRVQGKAVGGGVGLAAAVDYCYANSFAAIKLSELALGIGPFVIGPAVKRKIGLAAFGQLSLNPTEWYSAEWALQKGLYQEVFEKTEHMDHAIQIKLAEWTEYHPEALFQLKKILWENTTHWDQLLMERAAISGRLVLSDYTRDAILRIKKNQK